MTDTQDAGAGERPRCTHLTMRASTYRYASGDPVAAQLHMTCNACGQQWWYRREAALEDRVQALEQDLKLAHEVQA